MIDSQVDVLMATYNGEKYLAEQIDSILNQDYKCVHLYIRDDCSSDLTVAIIKEKIRQYPSKITLINSNEKLGIVGNFSELMKHSKANYIMFSDQDDVWLPFKITETLKVMRSIETRESKIPILVHTDLEVVGERLESISPSFWKYIKLYPQKIHSFNRILVQNVITGCTVMMNRILLEKAYPIPKESVMHDWWIGLVASAFGKIVEIPQATVRYRQHLNNSLGAKKPSVFMECKRFLDNMKEYRSKLHCSRKRQIKQSEIFSNIYNHDLSPEQKKILAAYPHLYESNCLQKIVIKVRHGLYKNGFLRNLRDTFL